MKKLLFPSAILCALSCAALVTPASALPVTSSDPAPIWSIEAPPVPPGPGPVPMTVPTVKVIVYFHCTNPNDTTQSFDQQCYLFSGNEDDFDNLGYISTQTIHVDVAPLDEEGTYTLPYQNTTTAYPNPGSEWTLFYSLPGENPNYPYSLRSAHHTY